tara:strand:+ start:1123 stop:1356 length:234 start_codon:yes stop_codon:yes gene_type:complete
MATVTELSGNGGGQTGAGPENEYSRTSVAASALYGTTTPSFVGQKGTDTTNDQVWIAQRADVSSETALANTDWARTE